MLLQKPGIIFSLAFSQLLIVGPCFGNEQHLKYVVPFFLLLFFLIRIHCKVTQFKSKCHAVQTKPDFLEISTFKSAFPKEHFSQWLSCPCLDAVPGGCPCITEEPGLGRAAPDQGVKCGNWSISLLWRYGMSEASSHRNFVLVQLKSIRK